MAITSRQHCASQFSDMPATRTRTTTFVSAISQNCRLDIFAYFWEDTMHQHRSLFKTVITTVAIGLMHTASAGEFRGFDYYDGGADHKKSAAGVQLGQRPFYLIDGMDDSKLKERLQQCRRGPFYRTDFSIGHRGAALQFPEHTRESYEAAARQGAGIVECDTTFTKDGELVCRHSECDLHTTTNIVDTPLNAQCTTPWSGA